MLPKFLWTEVKAETCLWRCNEFFSGAGVLEMQSIPLCNNYFFSHSNHRFHPTRNSHEAPGDVQPSATQCTKPSFICHLFACWGYELSPNNFSSQKPFCSFCWEHLDPPFLPCTKLSCSSVGCDDRSQNAEMCPSILTNEHCWQSHYLTLQRAAKEKFSCSGGASICLLSILKLEFVSLTNLVLTTLYSTAVCGIKTRKLLPAFSGCVQELGNKFSMLLCLEA